MMRHGRGVCSLLISRVNAIKRRQQMPSVFLSGILHETEIPN